MSDGCAASERLRDSRLAELGEASCFDEQCWFPPDESAEQSWYNCPPLEELFPEASEGDEIQPGVVEEEPTAPVAEAQSTNFVSAGSWCETVENPRMDLSNAFGAAFQSSQPTGMKHVWEQGIWSDIFSERDPMRVGLDTISKGRRSLFLAWARWLRVHLLLSRSRGNKGLSMECPSSLWQYLQSRRSLGRRSVGRSPQRLGQRDWSFR